MQTRRQGVHSGRVRDVKEVTDEELARMIAHVSEKIALEESQVAPPVEAQPLEP